jgi:hypothetical protein
MTECRAAVIFQIMVFDFFRTRYGLQPVHIVGRDYEHIA